MEIEQYTGENNRGFCNCLTSKETILTDCFGFSYSFYVTLIYYIKDGIWNLASVKLSEKQKPLTVW